MQFLSALTLREIFIGLALIGAVVSTFGGYLLRKNSTTDPRTARFVLRVGYVISWASVVMFVAVGLLSVS